MGSIGMSLGKGQDKIMHTLSSTCASGERGFMVAMACTAGKQGLVSLEEIRPPLASLVLNILALTIASHSEMLINMWLPFQRFYS